MSTNRRLMFSASAIVATATVLTAWAGISYGSNNANPNKALFAKSTISPASMSQAPAALTQLPAPAPGGPVSVTPADGQGIISMVLDTCDSAKNWESVAADNHINPPSYIVLQNASVSIDCDSSTTPAPGGPVGPIGTDAPIAKTGGSTSSGEWGKPVVGMTCKSYPGDGFNVARYSNGEFTHWHAGVDLGSSSHVYNGNSIVAIHSGTVRTGYQATGAGIYVVVNHGDGTSSYYFHMSKRVVSDGEHVAEGQLLGYVGQTGNANPALGGGGPHLHFEIHKNVQTLSHFPNGTVDPIKFLEDHGVNAAC